MSIEVMHACRVCHTTGDMQECTKCHTAIYCSRKCQKLDWEEHKKFCLKAESKELEIARRFRVLKSLNDVTDLFSKLLLRQKLINRPAFVLVEDTFPSTLVFLSSQPLLEQEGVSMETKVYEELGREVERQAEKPCMVILHKENHSSKVYTVSSVAWAQLHHAITGMPDDLLEHILGIDNEAVLQQVLYAGMMGSYLRTGKKAHEKGGFFDEYPNLFPKTPGEDREDLQEKKLEEKDDR